MIFRARRRDARVVGLIPSSSAAPPSAINATIGTLERLHQIRTLARSNFAVRQDDLCHVGS